MCYYSVKVDCGGARFEDSACVTRNVILENNIEGNFV